MLLLPSDVGYDLPQGELHGAAAVRFSTVERHEES